MRVLVTGSEGFIARNLLSHLAERDGVEILGFNREDGDEVLASHVAAADFIFHLAGVNRPRDDVEFETENAGLTEKLCDLLARRGSAVPVVFSSSIQATMDNAYGRSKRRAEELLLASGERSGFPVYIFRLPNVFGKWAKPHYNSVVATFCFCGARSLPVRIDDPDAQLKILYIDDLVAMFLSALDRAPLEGSGYVPIGSTYSITVGELADQIQKFAGSRVSLVTERVGENLLRALYATYVSYLPTEDFSYVVPRHADPRGVFVEMLKTKDSGQFSFFTALPGVTRGGHYHHTKTEKFLIIRGEGRFRFRHLLTGEQVEIFTSEAESRVVETIPGWTHDITNIGETELVVMLWANEIFDRNAPDTYAQAV